MATLRRTIKPPLSPTLPMPAVESAPIRTAAAGLADLIHRVGPDTVAGLILTQAQRELSSLSRMDRAGTVSGPHRLKVAA